MKETNSIPVSLQLRTEIFQNEQFDEHFFDVTGQMVRVGKSIYLRYQEPAIVEIDGHEGINVTVKIEEDGSIQLIRADKQRMRLRFTSDKVNEANYHTPYGIIPIKIITKKISITLEEHPVTGEVLIDYELHTGEEPLGVYHLSLQFTA